MNRTHVIVVIGYTPPTAPEVYLIPRDFIPPEVWDAMHEDRGGPPNWCAETSDNGYKSFDIKQWAIAADGQIPDRPPIVVTHTFAYVVGKKNVCTRFFI